MKIYLPRQSWTKGCKQIHEINYNIRENVLKCEKVYKCLSQIANFLNKN